MRGAIALAGRAAAWAGADHAQAGKEEDRGRTGIFANSRRACSEQRRPSSVAVTHPGPRCQALLASAGTQGFKKLFGRREGGGGGVSTLRCHWREEEDEIIADRDNGVDRNQIDAREHLQRRQ
ncbi:hypothetical protein GQ55_5G113500 [Panicum hallii var. hallii]|uniref:Uncharacterized protein n=1 Tax=Panicum hallii var. hallii TaxID=1504633 RepID=A0A2T7DFA1_9POAL|nr:hypothetical protein GQ55_5G113500 [Panicum hallii var. hallii]